MVKLVKFPEMVGLGVMYGDTLSSSFTSINNMEPSSKDMFNQTQASLGELQASLATVMGPAVAGSLDQQQLSDRQPGRDKSQVRPAALLERLGFD